LEVLCCTTFSDGNNATRYKAKVLDGKAKAALGGLSKVKALDAQEKVFRPRPRPNIIGWSGNF